MVNHDGWTLTAAHVVRSALQALKAYNEYTCLNEEEQRRRLKQSPDTTITHAGALWGTWDNAKVTGEFILHETADIALFRLAGFRNPRGYRPPEFRTNVVPGESLCRVGYALLDDIPVTLKGDSFGLGQAPPLFVNEGIVSRFVSEDGAGSGRDLIEVSSPGLIGQSGGPVADTSARVCGIQVRTRHYRLGFGTEGTKFHIGQAVNASVICDFLRSHNVEFCGGGQAGDES